MLAFGESLVVAVLTKEICLEIIMNNNRRPNIYPGEILQLEFLEPLNITPYRLSKDIGVAQTRMS
nr:hypothetical protein [Nostoc sp. FACHB-133]